MAVYSDLVRRGLRSAQPAATAVATGTLFYVTDESKLERSSGSAWQEMSAVSAGGDSTTTAAKASRPAASNDGNLFLANDGFYVERDTGAAWAPWGPIFPLTEPVSGDFAWINQGTATIDTTYGGVHLHAAAAAGDSLKIRKKAAPATPYTITIAFIPFVPIINYANVGFCFRQSSDGKVQTFAFGSGSGVSEIGSSKYTNETTWSAGYTGAEGSNLRHEMFRGLVWLQASDNGTNRIIRVSTNGRHWVQLHSVGRTDFLTADEVGFYANSNNATWPAAMTLLHWKQE